MCCACDGRVCCRASLSPSLYPSLLSLCVRSSRALGITKDFISTTSSILPSRGRVTEVPVERLCCRAGEAGRSCARHEGAAAWLVARLQPLVVSLYGAS